MLLVLCSLAIPFPSKAAQIPDERLGPRLADQEELLTDGGAGGIAGSAG